jgi:hypothetical protein
VTAPPARHRLALADDGIIDLVAVEIAARGARRVALTRAERYLAAARILARGGTPYVIATRLQVSGTTALKLAAQSGGVPSGTARGRTQCLDPALLRTGTWSGIATAIRSGTAPQERDQLQQQDRPPRTPGRR